VKKCLARCALGLASLFAFASLQSCGNSTATAPAGKADRIHITPAQLPLGATINGITNAPWLQLEVFQMAVPAGGVSRSDDFWKHVEEQRLDPATYDLLLKNGVRVGVAPNDDWDYFREILKSNHALTTSGVATANGGGTVELSMKKSVPVEDIFYLDDIGCLHGRTYEHCENLLGISFWPEPRHPGEVRLAVSPTVRSLRTYLKYSVLNNESEIEEVRPEYLYDLNLRVVIPPDSFLVIAPSRDSKWSTTLGNTFFHVDGKAEQLEQVLVLAPHIVSRIGPTASARQTFN
jgi:hypothetical protein